MFSLRQQFEDEDLPESNIIFVMTSLRI